VKKGQADQNLMTRRRDLAVQQVATVKREQQHQRRVILASTVLISVLDHSLTVFLVNLDTTVSVLMRQMPRVLARLAIIAREVP